MNFYYEYRLKNTMIQRWIKTLPLSRNELPEIRERLYCGVPPFLKTLWKFTFSYTLSWKIWVAVLTMRRVACGRERESRSSKESVNRRQWQTHRAQPTTAQSTAWSGSDSSSDTRTAETHQLIFYTVTFCSMTRFGPSCKPYPRTIYGYIQATTKLLTGSCVSL